MDLIVVGVGQLIHSIQTSMKNIDDLSLSDIKSIPKITILFKSRF